MNIWRLSVVMFAALLLATRIMLPCAPAMAMSAAVEMTTPEMATPEMAMQCDDMGMSHAVPPLKQHPHPDCQAGCSAIGATSIGVAQPAIAYSILPTAIANKGLHGLRIPPITPPPQIG
jgi:hypothetical protein